MDPFITGSLISAAGSLLGGLFDSDSAEDASRRNYEMQKEFAQHGIQWKVDDAKRAGIHPLYAIGAPTMSATPSFVGSSMGSGISRAAESIGNSISARQDAVMDAKIKEANLDLVRAQADKVRSDMIVNMKKASAGALGRQRVRNYMDSHWVGKVPKYIKIYNNRTGKYEFFPNPDLNFEFPETYGLYQLGLSETMDDRDVQPDFALHLNAKSTPSDWNVSNWITY